ncbi:hypothetical protein J7L05_01295 [bacterium]|nr:hypothetical protein [bacterium]
MGCSEVKSIIDQVRDREIPESALDGIQKHIEECKDCHEYFEQEMSLGNLLENCRTNSDETSSVQNTDDFFQRMESEFDNLDEKKLNPAWWELMIYHPYSRPATVGICTLIVFLLGAFAINHYSFGEKITFGEKKLEASMERLPDGAILMRTSEGEEIIFLDPALEADGTLDDAIKELEEAMGSNSFNKSEEFSFVSY